MIFKAGYIVDEVFEFYRLHSVELDFDKLIEPFSSHTFFKIHGFDDGYLLDTSNDYDPLYKTVYNLITRGAPTRASLNIANYTLKRFGFSEIVTRSGDIKFKKTDNNKPSLPINNQLNLTTSDPKRIHDLIYKPILIAQIQYLFIHLLLLEKITLKDEWSIHASSASYEIIRTALDDMFDLFMHIEHLKNRPFKKPKLVLAKSSKLSYTVSIGILSLNDNENDYDYSIEYVTKPIKKQEDDEKIDKEFKFVPKILTSDRIRYNPIGDWNLFGELTYYDTNLKGLRFFLNNIFRKNDFREGQLPIINRVLQGNDVIGILPTGSGKSLIYQLCAVLQPGISLVIDPIRSLMVDQYEKLRSHFIDKVIYINSNDNKESRQLKEKLIALGYYQLLIIGPERFQISEFREYMRKLRLNNLHFAYTVIDEAHCISEWGHDFRFSYLRLSQNILRICYDDKKENFTQIALTATASFDVMADIQRELQMNNDCFLPIPSVKRDELHFDIVDVGPYELTEKEKRNIEERKATHYGDYVINNEFYLFEKGLAQLKYPILKRKLRYEIPDILKTLGSNSYQEAAFWEPNESGFYPNAGLIFCRTKSDALGNGVYAIANNLYNQRDNQVTLEGLSSERDYLELGTFMGGDDDNSWENVRVNTLAANSVENQKKYINNKLNLMVATQAFGMGIDKPNIRFTIHYSLPQSIENFYQEAGRAGRDRVDSYNLIIYSKTDVERNLDFIKNSHKGTRREKTIFDELLTKVRYEDKFF